MRIVLNLPGASRADAERIAAGIAALTGVQPIVVGAVDQTTAALRPRPGAVPAGRFVVANSLGCHVASLDEREAAMLLALLERAPGTYPRVGELRLVLEGWPCWQGQRHLVVPTYRALRAKLAAHQLVVRGGYGFVGQRRPDLHVIPG